MSRKKMSAEAVVATIVEIHIQEEKLNSKFIKSFRNDFYELAQEYFGGWSKAVYAAGINYLSHCRNWSTKAWLKSLTSEDVDKIRQRIRKFTGGEKNGNRA